MTGKSVHAGFANLQPGVKPEAKPEKKKEPARKKPTKRFREEYIDRRQKEEYRPILDDLEWKVPGGNPLCWTPERYFRMIDEVSEECTFFVEPDEEKGMILVGTIPNVFCSGETLVDTRVDMHRETVRDTFSLSWPIDPENPVLDIGFGVCKERKNPKNDAFECAYHLCPARLALYLAYLQASGNSKIIKENRNHYDDIKDVVDLDRNNPWYTLKDQADLIFHPYGRDYYLDIEELQKARAFLDEGLYASEFVLIPEKGAYIFAKYDGTYRRMDVKGFRVRNGVTPYSDLTVESRPAESTSQTHGEEDRAFAKHLLASESDFRQFSPCPYCDNSFCEMKYAAFVDMLIQSGQYQDYYENAKLEEQTHKEQFKKQMKKINELSSIQKILKIQDQFFGCVSGNTKKDVKETAQLIAREISVKPTVSPNIASMSMLEFLKELKENQYYKKITDYLEHAWGTPAKNQVYILNGVNEFLKVFRSNREVEAFRYVIELLSVIEDGNYFIITGSKEEIDDLFLEFSSIEKVFSLNRIDLKDMTPEEIYKDMLTRISPKLKEEVKDSFRKQALEYIALNQGVIPYKNKEMASYLASYINQNGLTLPDFRKADVEKMLSEMIGMENIKTKIREFDAFAKFKKQVIAGGGNVPSANTHMAFMGNHGTGKTTVARIIAQMLFDIGLLRKNTVIEVQRKDLIAEYVGQTAIKTQQVIDKAMGGVLFIDEAYSLAQSGSKNDFGGEAIATLIKAMEDHKDDFVVIFAGYVNEMEEFISSNPGLQSRIGYIFNFEDYQEDELAEMFCTKMKSFGFRVSPACKDKVKEVSRYFKGQKDFGNGRFIDSLIQETLVRRAVDAADKSKTMSLNSIKKDDIPGIEDILKTTLKGWEMISPNDISPEELEQIAVHELGHALAGFYLTGDMEIVKITVRADASGALGYVQYEPKRKALVTEEDLKSNLAVTLSGKNAEELVYDTHSSGCSSDVKKATMLARRMVTEFAMGNWPDQSSSKRLLKEADAKSIEILKEHKDELLSLKEKLIDAGTINKDEIKDFLGEKRDTSSAIVKCSAC